MATAEDELRAQLRDPDPDIRVEAAAELAKLGSWEGRAALVAGLKDDDSEVRSSAAFNLGQIGASWAIEPLAKRLADPDSSVRNDAIFALAATNHVAAVPHLIRALDDEDLERREDARVALVSLLGKEIGGVMAVSEEHVDDEAGKARAWWKANASRFPPATRYDWGKPVSIGRWIDELPAASAQVIGINLERLTTWTGENFGPADKRGVKQTWHKWWAKNGRQFPPGKRYFWGRAVD
jgi:hypothetical protein